MKETEIIKLLQDNPGLRRMVLRTLPTREADIFYEYYVTKTPTKIIGKEWDLTLSRIYQIIKRARRLVCHSSRRHIINNFLWRF